jgi:signal transduction histidine kinase
MAYVERAREGIERLNGILTRMSEATRLEQTLQQEQVTEFNIESVVSSCVKGYQLAKPNQAIEFVSEGEAAEQKEPIIKGAPDLIAQMLDKLVSNAISFTTEGTPIVVALQQQDGHVLLKVSNQGPLLPAEMQNALFDSMVSIRQKKGSEPHLGLGLYIVRLIAEFHNGQVSARNRNDAEGVEFTIKIPLV